MTELPLPTRSPWWHTLVTAALAALLVLAAARMMLSAFMIYDDEGYVLLSLRNFHAHGALYRDVYTQYGPFPYVLYAALQAAGVELTHLFGRALTLAAWTGTALCCATVVRQSTRSFVATIAVLVAAFPYLWVTPNEPSHPGGLIMLLTAAAAVIGCRFLLQARAQAWAIAVGAIAGALLLTKINVGVFALLSALTWMLLHARNADVRRRAQPLLLIAVVVLPLGLMHALLLREPWVQIYALVFVCSTVAAIAAIAPGAPLCGRRELAWGAAAAGMVCLVTLGIVMARGSSVRDLFDGIVLAPTKHPVKYSVPFPWPWVCAPAAVASLVVCTVAVRRRQRGDHRMDVAIALLRFAATAAFIVAALLPFPDVFPDRALFAFAAPGVWLFLWPLAGESSRAVASRAWLGLLFLGQFLHAYPVCGSQMAWGTVLILPLAAMSTWESGRWLAQHFAGLAPGTRRNIALVTGALVVACAARLFWGFVDVASRYQNGSDLALPGAESIRLPSRTTAALRIMALNATAHSDLLFSEPGMFSFNLWTRLPTPTSANVTHWFSLLSYAQQRAILRRLEEGPKAAVIIQRMHLGLLRDHGFSPSGPLHDYIDREFAVAISSDGYEFRVRRGREIAPLLIGEMRLRARADAGTDNTALEVRLVLPLNAAVSRIELESIDTPQRTPLVFDAARARLEVTPISLQGVPLGPPQPASWPLTLAGPALVSIQFDRSQQPRPVAGGLIRLLGLDGTEIALAQLHE